MSQICPVCFITSDEEEGKNLIFIIHSCKHAICEECFLQWHILKRNNNCVICRQTVLTIPRRRVRRRPRRRRGLGPLPNRCCVLLFFIVLILLSVFFLRQRRVILTIMVIICSVGIFISLVTIDNYIVTEARFGRLGAPPLRPQGVQHAMR